MKQVFLAQLVEQLTLNQWVQGSSPWEDTKKKHPIGCLFLCVIIHCRYRLKYILFFLTLAYIKKKQ